MLIQTEPQTERMIMHRGKPIFYSQPFPTGICQYLVHGERLVTPEEVWHQESEKSTDVVVNDTRIMKTEIQDRAIKKARACMSQASRLRKEEQGHNSDKFHVFSPRM